MNSEFTYTGIRVRDIERAIRFYTEGLGMELRGRRKIPRTGGENVDLASPGSDRVLELNWYPRKGMVKEFRHGARLAVEPFHEHGSWVAFMADPDGIWIELLSKDP